MVIRTSNELTYKEGIWGEGRRGDVETSFPREYVSKTTFLIFYIKFLNLAKTIFERRLTRRRGATGIMTGDDYRSKRAEDVAVREEKAKKKQKKGNPPRHTPPPPPPRPKAPARKSRRVLYRHDTHVAGYIRYFSSLILLLRGSFFANF